MTNNMKLIIFQTSLRGQALWWFIKWSELHQNLTLDQIKRNFVQEFKLGQMNQQGLSELCEIKQREGEIM